MPIPQRTMPNRASLKASQKDQGSKTGRQDRGPHDHREPQAVKETAQDEGGHGIHPHGDGIK